MLWGKIMSFKILKDLNKVISELERTGNREASKLHSLFVKLANAGRFCNECGKEVGKFSSMCGACGAVVKDQSPSLSVLDSFDEEGQSEWRPGTKEETTKFNEWDKGKTFCAKCGEKLSSYASMCPSCGTSKKYNEGVSKIFCVKCGTRLDPSEPYCPDCGSPK